MWNLIIIQAFIVAAVGGYFAFNDAQAALAALYGGAIALINSILLSRRVIRAKENLQQDPKTQVASLYFGAVQRFLFTFAAMVIGMGYFKLDPIALLIAFAAAQAGYWIAGWQRAGTA